MRLLLGMIVVLFCLPATAQAQEDIGLLRSLGVHTQDAYPTGFATLADGTVVFSADDGAHGRELWRTDGTAEGTQLLADLVPGLVGSEPDLIESVGRMAYFTASSVLGRREVWRTDGTAKGTRSIAGLEGRAGGTHRARGTRGRPAADRLPAARRRRRLGDLLDNGEPRADRERRRADARARRLSSGEDDRAAAAGIDRRRGVCLAQRPAVPHRRYPRGDDGARALYG